MKREFAAPSYISVDGRRLAYDEVCPSDPKGTILLLTGLGSKRLDWSRQIENFGRMYRTIALDHRDTGDSDAFNGPYTVVDLADDAAAVLDALGVERVHVVGISLGGFVALALAARRPDLVDKLVLTSTSAGGSAHVLPSQEMIARLSSPARNLEIGEAARRSVALVMAPGYAESHPEELDRIVATVLYRPQSQTSYLRQLQAALFHDVVEQVAGITAPTLVIHGEDDPLIPVANGRYLAERLPGARLILYPGVGHIPIIECAEQFNRDVLAFLQS